jgi:hypothetical protein
VHQHQPHAQRREQVEIVRESQEAAVGNDLAAESDDEGLAAKSVDVGRDRLEPVDEPVLRGKPRSLCSARRGLCGRRRCGTGISLAIYRRLLFRLAPAPLAGVIPWRISSEYQAPILCDIESQGKLGEGVR